MLTQRTKLVERTPAEFLAEVFRIWRTDAWNGRPCRSFAPAAMRRLARHQPYHADFAALIDNDVVRGADRRSRRLDALRHRFVAGVSQLDPLPDPDETEDEAEGALMGVAA